MKMIILVPTILHSSVNLFGSAGKDRERGGNGDKFSFQAFFVTRNDDTCTKMWPYAKTEQSSKSRKRHRKQLAKYKVGKRFIFSLASRCAKMYTRVIFLILGCHRVLFSLA